MATGRDIHVDDLPPELRGSGDSEKSSSDWEAGLFSWVNKSIANGETDLLGEAFSILKENVRKQQNYWAGEGIR